MRCKIPDRDLAQKLDTSICRYDGLPVYCRVMSKSRIDLYALADTGGLPIATIKPRDEKFDVSGVPLGCMQSPLNNRRAVYLSRSPIRRTKQGLHYSSVLIRRLGEDELRRVTQQDYVFSQPFIDMVKGVYPPLSECLNRLRTWHKQEQESIHEIAVNINIGLSINAMGIIFVYFKNQFVGWIPPESNTVIVPESDKAWVISKFLSDELSWKVE